MATKNFVDVGLYQCSYFAEIGKNSQILTLKISVSLASSIDSLTLEMSQIVCRCSLIGKFTFIIFF